LRRPSLRTAHTVDRAPRDRREQGDPSEPDRSGLHRVQRGHPPRPRGRSPSPSQPGGQRFNPVELGPSHAVSVVTTPAPTRHSQARRPARSAAIDPPLPVPRNRGEDGPEGRRPNHIKPRAKRRIQDASIRREGSGLPWRGTCNDLHFEMARWSRRPR